MLSDRSRCEECCDEGAGCDADHARNISKNYGEVEALKNLTAGGRLVINAIRKEDLDQNVLLEMDYPSHLWLEKEIKSVANVARSDVAQFLELADRIPIIPEVETFCLEEANQALLELKTRKIRGAKVLVMDPD